MSRPIILCLLLCLLLLPYRLSFAEHNSETEYDFFDYHWGRGITIPSAKLNIGGYLQASYRQPENRPDAIMLNDLSLFITWSPHDRLRFFAELDQQNWFTSYETRAFNDALSVERLFVDYLFSGTTTLRFGKFLTPFGRWNIIHSAPLVWTTNRPVVTNDFSFASRANGLLFSHTYLVNEHNLDLSIYLDDSTDLDPKPNKRIVFDKAAGTRINYELTEELQVGFSYLAYQTLADLDLPTHHVVGVDAMWQHEGYELLFESLYHTRNNTETNLDEKGFFIQGVAPIAGQISAVGRYEYVNSKVFQSLTNNNVTHIGVGGLAWRPFVPLVIKTEYRFGENNRAIAPSGLFISIAMFF